MNAALVNKGARRQITAPATDFDTARHRASPGRARPDFPPTVLSARARRNIRQDKRVKVSGYSMGGQMALILASQEPRITAVAAIVPPYLDDKVAAVSPLRFMPGLAGKKLWLLSADADEHASAEQNQALFDALPGSDKKHLRFPGGHLLPAGYAASLAPWF